VTPVDDGVRAVALLVLRDMAKMEREPSLTVEQAEQVRELKATFARWV